MVKQRSRHVTFSKASLFAQNKIAKANIYAISALGLAVVAVLAFSLNIRQLGLYSDDWTFLAGSHHYGWSYNFGYLNSQRPLHVLHWTLTYPLFKFNLVPRYIFQFAILWANSFFLFVLLNRIPSTHLALNFMTSALFLVYPTITTYFWLATTPIYIATFLFLLSLLIFEKSLRYKAPGTKTLFSTIAGAIFLLSLLFYEVHIAMCLITPIMVIYFSKTGQSFKFQLIKSIVWSTPYFCAISIYFFYRFVLMPGMGWVDPRATSWIFDPSLLISKFLHLRGTLFSIWKLVLERIFFTPERFVHVVTIFIIVTVLCFLCGLIVWHLSKTLLQEPDPTNHKTKVLGRDIGIFAMGVGLMILGYLPILPTDYWIAWPESFGSRVGYPAALGAAIAVVGGVNAANYTLANIFRWKNPLLLSIGVSSVFVGLGAAHCSFISMDYVQAWQIQKRVYSNLMHIIPDLADNTFVLLVDAPRDTGTARSILRLYGSLRLLYDNPSLDGRNVLKSNFNNPDSTRITSQGIIPEGLSDPIEDERLILVEYDEPGCLQIVDSFTQLTNLKIDTTYFTNIKSNRRNILLETDYHLPSQILLDLNGFQKIDTGCKSAKTKEYSQPN